jgi:hypothetical protein
VCLVVSVHQVLQRERRFRLLQKLQDVRKPQRAQLALLQFVVLDLQLLLLPCILRERCYRVQNG